MTSQLTDLPGAALASASVLVVGSGWAGHAARALSRVGALAGIVARGSPRSRALAAETGARLFGDVATALAVTQPRRAIVAAGEHEHAALLEPLLLHGLDVLCAHPVLSSAQAVEALAVRARLHGTHVLTDYTLRRGVEVAALLSALPTDGPLLRLHIESPGRWLPIAIDLALLLGGRVTSVHAVGAWPVAISNSTRATAAFPPSILLSHDGGVATAWTPVTHRSPAHPLRLVASLARAAWTLELPSAGALRVALGRRRDVSTNGPDWHDAHIAAAVAEAPAGTVAAASRAEPTAPIIDAWTGLTLAFAGGHYEGLATLAEEAERRRVWAAIWRARTTGFAVVQP